MFATPFARKVARESGVDISRVVGSGPHGRVLHADVASFVASSPAAASAPVQAAVAAAAPAPVAFPVSAAPVDTGLYMDVAHTSLRRALANQLTVSKQTVPHYSVSADVHVDNVLKLRERLNGRLKESDALSLNDFFVKAAALALRKVPEVNSSWLADSIRSYQYVDISVSMGISDGVVAPVVRNVQEKGL